MNDNTITGLREELFDTLRQLKDKEKPMDINRAKAVSEVAGKIIETAKVEVDMMRVANSRKGTGFVPLPAPEAQGRQLPPPADTMFGKPKVRQ